MRCSYHVVTNNRGSIVAVDEGYHTRGASSVVNSTCEEVVFNSATSDGTYDTASLILAALDNSVGKTVAHGTAIIGLAILCVVNFASNRSYVVATLDVRVKGSTVGNNAAIHTTYDTAHIGVTYKVCALNAQVGNGGVLGLAEEAYLALVSVVILQALDDVSFTIKGTCKLSYAAVALDADRCKVDACHIDVVLQRKVASHVILHSHQVGRSGDSIVNVAHGDGQRGGEGGCYVGSSCGKGNHSIALGFKLQCGAFNSYH